MTYQTNNSKTFNCNQSRGYVALISAIIISVLLTTITFSLGMTGFFARFNILNSEYKNISSNLAEGCVDSAILKLINNPTYNPPGSGEVVSIGANSCTIVSVSPSNPRLITVKASYPQTGNKRSFTKMEVRVNILPGGVTINSWEEVI